MKLVLVESPAKAKTIEKYLGKDFQVFATMGHVRDLIPKSGSVDPDDHFNMLWAITTQGQKTLPKIYNLSKNADAIYLATDPDREGEGIAWHVKELLKQKKVPESKIYRATFHEITKAAVQEAIQNPRTLDMNLVHAYLARRSLDYLFGFQLSPILWRKLPSAKSAGRVQSVALRFVTENEDKRNKFVSREYFSIEATIDSLGCQLISINGKKIPSLGLTKQQSDDLLQQLKKNPKMQVFNVKHHQTKQSPLPPFSTSLLQQTASTRLGYTPRKTMQLAQRLYEGINIQGSYGGLITYMRTDSFTLSKDALTAIRSTIAKVYSKEDVPDKPRIYKTKVKNAQEAHEAVRPTDMSKTPDQLKPYLDSDLLTLYTLIWNRTMASQMCDAKIAKHTIQVQNNHAAFQLNGQQILNKGFLKAWPMKIEEKNLPKLQEKDEVTLENIQSKRHETEPPARLNDASLIKTLEEHGIGRPSTYSSIISILVDRHYTIRENKRVIPTPTGRILVSFLVHFFDQFVEPTFTASLEDKLDAVSNGESEYQQILQNFWNVLKKHIDDIADLNRDQITEAFEKDLAPYLEEKDFHRLCPTCKKGHLHMKIGKSGLFLGCDQYPECNYTETLAFKGQEHKIIGEHPKTNQPIYLKHGTHGPYVESMQNDAPKRSSISRPFTPAAITLDQAVFLLSLPKDLGTYKDHPILFTTGPFGPYVRYADQYFVSVPRSLLMILTKDDAINLVEKHLQKLKDQTIGMIDDLPIYFKKSRFGVYLSYKNIKYPLPKDSIMKQWSITDAQEFIQNAKNAKKKKTPSKKTRKKK